MTSVSAVVRRLQTRSALPTYYKKTFAESTQARQAAGIAAPQEIEDGYLFAADLNTSRRLEVLAGMLEQRGHSGRRIEKILGTNVWRVCAAAFKEG